MNPRHVEATRKTLARCARWAQRDAPSACQCTERDRAVNAVCLPCWKLGRRQPSDAIPVDYLAARNDPRR